MFWKSPFGSILFIVIGITRFSSSAYARSREVATPFGIGMNGGAPKDNCNALAPNILAFSNRVRVGGPMCILPLLVLSY